MASGGKVDYKQLEAFRDKLQKQLNPSQIDFFLEQCAKELAARLLAKVIKRTPVGDYSKLVVVEAKRKSKKYNKGDTYIKRINPSGKHGGTLRRGWTAGKTQGAAAYVQALKVLRFGGNYVINIVNPTSYASYVEFGHRQTPGRYVPAIGKRLTAGWVEGKFMLTISEQEVQESSRAILEAKLKKKLGECFK